MDAYIDLSFIFHVIVLFTLPYYYKRILNIKIKKMELLSIVIFSFVLYFNVFIFSVYKYLNLLFLLIYFLILYKKQFIKYYLLFMFVYYSNIATTMIFSNDIYLLNCVVFLASVEAIFYVLFIFMNILFIEIITFSIKSIRLLKNYRSHIKIKLNNEFSDFVGYIDSGNTLLVEGLPVVFLKDIYFSENDKEMIVHGIGARSCKYFKTIVIFQNKEKEVIVASSNSGFKGCECLINIHLLEEKRNETIK